MLSVQGRRLVADGLPRWWYHSDKHEGDLWKPEQDNNEGCQLVLQMENARYDKERYDNKDPDSNRAL
jgi:hypothetical protein